MLSRAAVALNFIGRDLERADQLARSLDVHLALSLDRPPEPDFWTSFARLSGWPGEAITGPGSAIRTILSGNGRQSIRGSVLGARTAAQSVRPSIPTEVYEQLNSLRWRVQDLDSPRDLHAFLISVQTAVRVVDGLLEDTMPHDEARDFMRLGKFLTRADFTVRLVTQRCEQLTAAGEDALEWTAVLKTCFAFESYRGRTTGAVTREGVVAFLLLDRALPRSALFALTEAQSAVARIARDQRGSTPPRLLRALVRSFEAADPLRVAETPTDFARTYAERSRAIEAALRDAYFHPSKVTRTGFMGDAGGRMPQQ